MASQGSTIRTITIKGVTEGLDVAASKLRDLGKVQGEVARSSDALAVSTDTATRSRLSAAASLDRLQRQLDANYRAQDAVARVTRDLDRASAQGLVNETRRSELLALAAARYGSATAGNDNYRRSIEASTKATGLARHELVNFGRQLNDIGTQAALGQSPFQILASQAGQLADIFTTTQGSARGILSQFAGGIGRFATSGLGVAAAGAGAGIWAGAAASSYVDGQREVERALRGVGAASGVTVDQINRLADAQAGAARISVASAREVAATYAGTGRVNPGQLPGLIDFTRQYGAFTGQGTAEAAGELAKAFADPSRGAEALADKLGGLNAASQRWIRDQQAAGNMLGAQASLLEAFRAQVEGSTDRVGAFAKAWDTVRRSVSDADDALGRFIAGSASAEQQLAALQAQRDRFAALPTRTSRATNRVAEMDAEIARLSAIVELDRQRAAIDERVAKAANASRAASAISDRMNPYGETLRELTADRSKLEEAMRLNPRSGETEAWAKSLDRINSAMATLLPNAEREKQSHELNIRAINARTLAERTAIEVARESLRLSGEKVSAAEREIAMQRKAAEVAAQAQRDAADALRTSRDQLELSGRTPAERSRLEIEQRYRDNQERFGGVTTSMPAATAAANGLDAAFAESLRKLREAVPGLSITSGFRTFEQQAKLYAEKGPGWAAPPGRSQHERGLAADLSYNGSGNIPAWVREKAAGFGIGFPLANRAVRPEPWHAEPIGGRNSAGSGGSSVADEIRRNELTARDRNAIDSVLGNSNRELERQRELLALSAAAWGKSSEEIARASKSQELVNALQREGVAIGPGLQAQINQTAAGYGDLARQQEQLRASQEALRTVGDLGRDTLRGIYGDLRNGASGAEILTNAFDRLASKLMDMAVNDLFGKAFGGTGLGLFSGGSGGGGFFGGLFGGFGGGSGLGTTPGAGGLYADGGFTGHGSKWSPAGIVHRGEVVWSQADVSRAGGVGVVEAMRRGMPGYANGGAPGYHATPSFAAANSNGPQVNVHNYSGQQASVEKREDGSLDIIIGQVEGRIAERVVRQQGSMSTAIRSTADGRQLRG